MFAINTIPNSFNPSKTRSTLQFASRAKLVTTNATVNEVLDESAKLKRVMKELEELRVKQRNSVSDGARQAIYFYSLIPY